MSSYTSTSKFISILPYVLLEYRYTTTPTIEEYPVNTGPTTAGFEKIVNGYFDNVQILNSIGDTDLTGNTRNRSVVQTSDSTFVDLSINYFTEYLDYDNKLTDTANIDVTFPSNILVQYDTIRYHFLSGYNFPDNDGVILQIKLKENSGVRSVISQIIVKKSDTENIILNPNRIYYNGSIYDKYVEVKIPAPDNMCLAFDVQSGDPSQVETLAALISSDGGGFVTGAPFNIIPYEITATDKVNGYWTYRAAQVNTAVMSPRDEYESLAATLNENSELNYWEYYPTWEGQFIEDFIYTENSLGNLYYVINEIVVSEQIGLRLVETSRFQTIQTSGFDSPQIFRPIVTNSRATSFTIDYSISLVNKATNTSIIRMSSVTSTDVDLYGAGLNRINLRNDPYPLKVYNKVVESSKITSTYKINVNPINNIITKYVPAFFQSENISVSEQDLTIKNIGSINQTNSVSSTTAFGQGKLKIVVNPFDNYYKFRLFNSNEGAENTILDLGNNSSYYLVFNGDNGNQIKVASLKDTAFQNPTKGEVGFRVVEADSKTIQSFINRDFHITALSPNGIETSVYYGTWILPSERQLKNSGSSGSAGTAGTSGTSSPVSTVTETVVEAAPVSTVRNNLNVKIDSANILANANINVLTSDIKSTFDIKKDSILKNITPMNLNNAVSSSSVSPVSTGTIGNGKPPMNTTATVDIVALSNSIASDEALGKAYNDIADYYTIPGRPGYNTYKGITKEIFLSAVRRVHPSTSGVQEALYTNYATYLGLGPVGGIRSRIR